MGKIFKITESQLRFLKQNVKNEILNSKKSNLIDESVGVSDEVLRATKELHDKALTHSDELITGNKVSFKLCINDFVNIDVNLFPSTNTEGESYYKTNRKMAFINIKVKIINNKIDWAAFMDTAQHEVNHVFEQDMVRKTCYSQASLEAKSMIYDKNINNRVLGIIAYISDPFEQQGMINGMYAFINQCKKDGSLPVNVSKIDAYQQLAKLYAAKNFMEDHKNDENLLKSIHPEERIGFGWTRRKFRNRAKEGIKNLELKIQRTLKKCKEDGLSENGIVVEGEEEFLNNIANNNISL